MAPETRPLRADAERNRRRLLDAAEAMFSERGLDVGVAEIAARAGVGRGTLFRNFATKDDLIAAIVGERMARGDRPRSRSCSSADDPGQALFEFLAEIVGRQQTDRALFEAVADTFLAKEEIARPTRSSSASSSSSSSARRRRAPCAATSARLT